MKKPRQRANAPGQADHESIFLENPMASKAQRTAVLPFPSTRARRETPTRRFDLPGEVVPLPAAPPIKPPKTPMNPDARQALVRRAVLMVSDAAMTLSDHHLEMLEGHMEAVLAVARTGRV